MSPLRPIPGLGPGFYESVDETNVAEGSSRLSANGGVTGGDSVVQSPTPPPPTDEQAFAYALLWQELCNLLDDGVTDVLLSARHAVLDTGARACRVRVIRGTAAWDFTFPSLGECISSALAWAQRNPVRNP